MVHFNKRYHPPGTQPGTLVATGGRASVTLMDYDGDTLTEEHDLDVPACTAFLERPTTTWVHVQGPTSLELLGQLGALFHLHPLALEDVQNTGQRPKVEPYDGQFFIVLNRPLALHGHPGNSQVSLFLGQGFVVSFNDGPEDPFVEVRKRLRANQGSIRRRGADYLLYALTDLVIDEGFPVLEALGARIEELEEELLEAPEADTLGRIHAIKRELLLLRRMVWPHREVVNALTREEYPLIQGGTRLYLRDCYDHSVQIVDLLESYRDMTASMVDVYLSSASYRLNEVMRVLTIIATLFIPLTFISGIYGMNFDRGSPWNMPELGWTYGYLAVWGVMIVLAGGMLYYFRRKGWL